MWASFKTKSTFAKYAKISSYSGCTGANAAAQLLNRAGIYDVRVEQVGGFLSDHYDPTHRVLRLSNDVYNSQSLSAIGIACHEAGHAIQHAEHYAPLKLRTALVPITTISTNISYGFIMLGFFLSRNMILIGALLFAVSVIFSLVTLPVEWDASARAKKLMVAAGIVSDREAVDAGRVLNAAFLTYVAATVSAMLTLLYYLLRSGIFGGSDD